MGGPLSRYNVVTASGVESVIKYNAHDAEQAGLTDADLVDAEPPANGEGDSPSARPAKRRAAAQNKARTTTANKGPRAKAAPSTPPPATPAPPPAVPSPQSPDPGNDNGGPGGDD